MSFLGLTTGECVRGERVSSNPLTLQPSKFSGLKEFAKAGDAGGKFGKRTAFVSRNEVRLPAYIRAELQPVLLGGHRNPPHEMHEFRS